MDAKLFSGKILFYRGGTNDFTGSNRMRTGVMYLIILMVVLDAGGIWIQQHPTTQSPSQPLAGFTLNADAENASLSIAMVILVFGTMVRQRGFRLQGNI